MKSCITQCSLLLLFIYLFNNVISIQTQRRQTIAMQSPPISFIQTEFTQHEECDMLTQGPICLFNGDRILLPYNTQSDLSGYWSFDEIRPLDQSGHKNHAIGVVKPGASFGGYGSSALFSNGNFLQVLHNDMFNTGSFSFTFWIFMVDDYFSNDKGGRLCPLIQKGNDDLYAKNYERSPAIYFDRQEKNLKIYIKTAIADEGEFILSKTKITNQRWLHISLTKNEKNVVRLYVNGILDTEAILQGGYQENKSPLYIGNTPWMSSQCEFPFLMDELRYYSKALEEDYIQAEAAPALGGISPNFLKLGCSDCGIDEANSKCVNGYRLCTSIELHTGGYQIARSLGLLSWETHIWTHSALDNKKDYMSLKGLGLCCKVLE